MEKFYQTEWFGIQFKDITKLSENKIADNYFYNAFYKEFFRRFDSYEMLSDNWQKEKYAVVQHILKLFPNAHSLLSIGCGIGYIENLLAKNGKKVITVEPSEQAVAFLLKNKAVRVITGDFPDDLPCDMPPCDAVCSVAIDYVFNKKEFIEFLIKIKKSITSEFLLISASVMKKKSMTQRLLLKFKILLNKIRNKNNGQFWGYLRSPDELITSFKIAGFSILNYGFIDNNNFFILAK